MTENEAIKKLIKYKNNCNKNSEEYKTCNVILNMIKENEKMRIEISLWKVFNKECIEKLEEAVNINNLMATEITERKYNFSNKKVNEVKKFFSEKYKKELLNE